MRWKIAAATVLILLSPILITSCSPSRQEEETTNSKVTPPSLSPQEEKFLDLVERRTFLFFYNKTDKRGFTIESTAWPTGSIASSGFYLTSIPIAIERGWISYEKGRDLTLTTLNSYYDDPNDPDDFYVETKHGFFPHWFHQDAGKWSGVDCFSSIDTAILMAGVLTVRQYFSGPEAASEGTEEEQIVRIATKLYEAVDWDWMTNGGCTLSMGWKPTSGFLKARWRGYNEGILAVLLALGSPTHPISQKRCKGDNDPWKEWTATYKSKQWTPKSEEIRGKLKDEPYKFVKSTSPALFTYQYPHVWFDLRGKKDKVGINYFENSRIATFHNKDYCIKNPESHKGYGPKVWGLTACECPLHPNNYEVHGPYPDMDDGTIAPTAAGGSIVFTPQEAIETLRYMKEAYGNKLWGKYGFKDSFNLDIDWSSPTYIGIDQGTILTMIENYRTGLVHNLFMQNKCVKEAMRKAGFPDADTTPPAITRVKLENGKVMARVTDNVGVKSVILHWDDSKKEMAKEDSWYTAELPEGLSQYYIKAEDESENIAASSIHSAAETPWLPKKKGKTELPPNAPEGSLLVDRFKGCISKKGAGAWQGGTSTPKDAVITFDTSTNHGEIGCSMKIRYNVEKEGAYNGAWINLGNLDLRGYKELVFWVKGKEEKGYTTTFKVELKGPKGKKQIAEYIVKGITNGWKRIAIPVSEFEAPGWASEIDWGNVVYFTLGFEHRRATDKEGAIYVDDIYFSPERKTEKKS